MEMEKLEQLKKYTKDMEFNIINLCKAFLICNSYSEKPINIPYFDDLWFNYENSGMAKRGNLKALNKVIMPFKREMIKEINDIMNKDSDSSFKQLLQDKYETA